MNRGQYSKEGQDLELSGKQVKSATVFEYKAVIEFTDGTVLEVRGHTYGDCAIDFDVKPGPGQVARHGSLES